MSYTTDKRYSVETQRALEEARKAQNDKILKQAGGFPRQASASEQAVAEEKGGPYRYTPEGAFVPSLPPGVYSHDKWNKLLDGTFDEIKKLAALKGGEYSGDVDRLANFRRNGSTLGLPMETVWAIYYNKHHDALMQFIQDLHSGKDRPRLEKLAGRVDDMIVYLLLFKAMLEERNG